VELPGTHAGRPAGREPGLRRPGELSLRVRPLETADLPAAAALTGRAFGLDDDQAAEPRWQERIALPQRTDPLGSLAAEIDGELVGVAQALLRERLWCLATLAVEPDRQSTGAGSALLAAALAYGGEDRPGLIMASHDPRALRLYAGAGFSLRPALEAVGEVDRRRLPPIDARVREAGPADLEAFAEISRDLRGGPQTAELEHVLAIGDRLLRLGDRGFAAVRPHGAPWLLAARDPGAARALLCTALADAETAVCIRWISGQDWAVDVALSARLELRLFGALCVRGEPGTLWPYLPSGAYC
jgi:ribosomal protein S18 acetylase RimI-like enzyme